MVMGKFYLFLICGPEKRRVFHNARRKMWKTRAPAGDEKMNKKILDKISLLWYLLEVS